MSWLRKLHGRLSITLFPKKRECFRPTQPELAAAWDDGWKEWDFKADAEGPRWPPDVRDAWRSGWKVCEDLEQGNW